MAASRSAKRLNRCLLRFVPLLEIEAGGVDAVAQALRPRPVREDVAEMAAAGRTADFDPMHAVAVVLVQSDMVLRRRAGEARPAAAAVELGARSNSKVPQAAQR